MTGIAVKVSGLTKSFGRFRAIDGLDLRVKAGTIYGFLGPNGAGKTTAIRILLGLMMPDAGEIEIFGKNLFLRRNEIVKDVGAIVEKPCFFDYLTAYENLFYLSRLSGPVTKEKISEALDIVGLSEVENKKVRAFSLGMQQRLGIALALLPDNRLLFLDEPTNGLDPHGIVGVRRLVRKLCDEKGVTIFVSSHLLSEVEQICDYVGIINKGRKICEESISDLVTRYNRIELLTPDAERFLDFANEESIEILNGTPSKTTHRFVLEKDPQEIPHLIRKLVEQNISISSITQKNHSLEEIFVSLTKQDSKDQIADRF